VVGKARTGASRDFFGTEAYIFFKGSNPGFGLGISQQDIHLQAAKRARNPHSERRKNKANIIQYGGLFAM
jgi:hypothetical protein